MILDQIIKQDAKEHLKELYKQGQFLRERGYNKRINFKTELENFYDLEWRFHQDISAKGNLRYSQVLNVKDERKERRGLIPTIVIYTLESIAKRSVLDFTPKYEDLSYEKVRDCLKSPYFINGIDASLLTVGLTSAMAGTIVLIESSNSLQSIPLFLGSFLSLVTFYYHNKGQNEKIRDEFNSNEKRRNAFYFLYYDAAVKANSINEEFYKYFEETKD